MAIEKTYRIFGKVTDLQHPDRVKGLGVDALGTLDPVGTCWATIGVGKKTASKEGLHFLLR